MTSIIADLILSRQLEQRKSKAKENKKNMKFLTQAEQFGSKDIEDELSKKAHLMKAGSTLSHLEWLQFA